MFAIIVTTALTFTGFSTYGQSTSETQTGQTNDLVVGYILAKTATSVPQKPTCSFKQLKNGGVYRSLGKTTDGLLIICPLVNSQDALAIAHPERSSSPG